MLLFSVLYVLLFKFLLLRLPPVLLLVVLLVACSYFLCLLLPLSYSCPSLGHSWCISSSPFPTVSSPSSLAPPPMVPPLLAPPLPCHLVCRLHVWELVFIFLLMGFDRSVWRILTRGGGGAGGGALEIPAVRCWLSQEEVNFSFKRLGERWLGESLGSLAPTVNG